MTTTKILQQQADELSAREILTETNSGTYGAAECQRAIGVGDSRYGDYRVYTRVGDGSQRHDGCDKDEAPGYARKFRQELTDAQRELRDLRKKISKR